MEKTLFTKTVLKEFIHELDLHASADSMESIDKKLRADLEVAAVRCKANGRKTLMSQDI